MDHFGQATPHTNSARSLCMTHTDANSSDALRSLQMTEFGELAASLVHDLGQSIAAVQAAGELLESRLDSLNVPDDVKKMIEIVARAGHDLCRQHAVWAGRCGPLCGGAG